VFLCWKLGEESVTFWHEVDAGFAGRQPLAPGPESEDGSALQQVPATTADKTLPED
jgi:hypothetical protein